MLKSEGNLAITVTDQPPPHADNRWMASEMERFFQSFKTQLSQKLFLGNFLGSETPGKDYETRTYVQMIEQSNVPRRSGEVSN